MPTRRPQQGNTARRSSVYVYRSVNAILNVLIGFVHCTVSVEMYGGSLQHRNNVQPSALERWYSANPSPVDRCETEERSNQYGSWLEQELIERVMQNDFRA